ncbi:MAG TPA: LLM class flavin-dependent oxidoreductase [Acidimicrobiales bacterium]|nr:LLM class flavin-dependent oxidoreductase [Acidimicrobiales bacterium]
MKVGVTLPQFRSDPGAALSAAVAAESAGNIDGVFVFDHLWAIGQPDRPALSAWPLLGALAQRTERVVLGTLVARVGLLPDAVLGHHVATMLRVVGGDRFVAGLGAGDRLSKPENEAYGVAFPPVTERVRQLRACAHLCLSAGAEVWIGGRHHEIVDVASDLGVARNLWAVEPSEVGAVAATGAEVTWGGIVADHAEGAEALLRSIRDAGASWCVLAPAFRPGEPPEQAIKTISAAVAAA